MYQEPDGAVLLLFKDDKREEIFLIFRPDYTVWWLTGGSIEKGELPEQTALRETIEEAGFQVKLIRKLGICERLNRKGKVLTTVHYFEGRYLSGQYSPEFPGNIGKWFDIGKLPLALPSVTKQAIKYGVNFIGNEFSFRTTKKNLSCPLFVYLTHPKLLRKILKDSFA